MSTSLAYHTQGINGFQHHSFQFSDGKVIQRLKRKEFRCPKCPIVLSIRIPAGQDVFRACLMEGCQFILR